MPFCYCNGLVKYTATQLNSLTSLTLTTPAKYTVAMAEDAGEGWTIAPGEATTDGVTKDTEITATYNGTRHVKSVTAVVKAKPAANVATAPTATADVTAGTTTALVSAGEAEGGTMMYKVTTENTQPASTDGFSATVPTAESLAAGTYYVWYYVQADLANIGLLRRRPTTPTTVVSSAAVIGSTTVRRIARLSGQCSASNRRPTRAYM